MSTIAEMLQFGREELDKSGNEYSKYDRKVLLEHVTGKSYMQLLMEGESELSKEEEEEYRSLIKRRQSREPLQQIIGYTYFMDFKFFVSENVLIPRQDTEILVERVDGLLDTFKGQDKVNLLDMCCGSGCIGISLKKYHPEISLTMSDISDYAIELTNKNMTENDCDAVVVKSSLFDDIEGRFDIVTCNPPYIESDEIEKLMPEVKDHEPRLALDGGADGLDYYRKIVKESSDYIKTGGYLVFEIGHDQGERVKELMTENGYKDVEVIKDYGDLERVCMGRLEN